jgi:pantetheine-phosphate adenylyltransferase
MIAACFPGSFDPPTFGHLNVIERAHKLFERLYVVVAANRQKQSLFSPEERVTLLEEIVTPFDNVSVHTCDSLIVDFARDHSCTVLLRGVRSVQDFSFEFDLSILNKGLDPAIETLFMPTDPKYFVLRSSAIKELVSFGGDISSMVPPNVESAIHHKFKIEKDIKISNQA